ncbi:histone acetyltransferase HPA2 [Microbacterium testaceum StLB037]|uniref:Histone acetyltransferase HPA2 n=1 Tax=Microbacterium testaceum (strain StLB037) TaxID=979556 RepID=E8N9Z8_MICTS|nr:histone acetyltransferase HPA2 [Microbacterium testaceum StLB037]
MDQQLAQGAALDSREVGPGLARRLLDGGTGHGRAARGIRDADMVDIGNKVSLGFLVRLLRALDESSKRGSGSSGLLDVLSLLK